MEINYAGIEELYESYLYKECIETIASIMCSSLAEEDKAAQVERVLLEYKVIK